MAPIVLLHSALGLRPAVLDAADRLRALGHTVTTPDFYDGCVFATEAEGIAHRDAVGHRELLVRVVDAVAPVPDEAVLAGFSLGAFFAQVLAGRRPHARAAVLLHSVAAPRGPWNGVPVQVHRYAEDPWIDVRDVAGLGQAVRASGAAFEDVVVRGRGHLFTDLDTPDGNLSAYDAAIARMDAFLG